MIDTGNGDRMNRAGGASRADWQAANRRALGVCLCPIEEPRDARRRQKSRGTRFERKRAAHRADRSSHAASSPQHPSARATKRAKSVEALELLFELL